MEYEKEKKKTKQNKTPTHFISLSSYVYSLFRFFLAIYNFISLSFIQFLLLFLFLSSFAIPHFLSIFVFSFSPCLYSFFFLIPRFYVFLTCLFLCYLTFFYHTIFQKIFKLYRIWLLFLMWYDIWTHLQYFFVSAIRYFHLNYWMLTFQLLKLTLI